MGTTNLDTLKATEVDATALKKGAVEITASAAELNKLDGATVTTAELNKLAGAGTAVASGTQQATVADAVVAHALNVTFSDTEVEAALDALGVKINTLFASLEAFSINASA